MPRDPMHATYNHWLVALSVLVAITVSYTALRLAGRVAASERSGGRPWLVAGAISMGIGIWSMHFIGMLAFTVPIPLRYNVAVTLASLLIAMLTSGLALAIASRRALTFGRLAAGSALMGAGIAAMHYTGMAAIQIAPVITYDARLVAVSIAVAVSASFAALWLAFRLRAGHSGLIQWARGGAAVVMGLAIAGMHYTAMAAAMLAPNAYCFGGAAFDNSWLAFAIGLIALAVLAITLLAAVFDAHLQSRTRRDAQRLSELNGSLQHGKNLLTLATQAAGIACWEFDIATRKTVWTENEIPSLKAAGIDIRAEPDALVASLHPEDARVAYLAIRAAAAQGREVCAVRVRVIGPSGAIVHLQAHARLVCAATGRLERLLGVCWDVSEHVCEEEARRALQLQLRDASRQAGMAEVATGVLHSVGNVLNSLSVSAALLLTGLRDSRVGNLERVAGLVAAAAPGLAAFLESDPRGREIPGYLRELGEHLVAEQRRLSAEAQAIVEHVEHIGRIVAAQQAHARRGGMTEEFDVAELLDHAVALHFSADRDVTVRRRYERVPRVTLDRHRLIQILANLLANARQALRERVGQRILTVSVRLDEAGALIVEVEDSGVGMSEAMRARLFEFGFTSKPDGHGFGLHSSAILAQELGGELTGASDGPGKGARFTLRLPHGAPAAESQRRSA